MQCDRSAGTTGVERGWRAACCRRWPRELTRALVGLCSAASLAFPAAAHAQNQPDKDGPFEIDHRMSAHYDGIYSRPTQLGLQAALVAGIAGYALAEGSESRSGLTAWRSLDSMVITALTTQAAKVTFSRTRPSGTDDAGKFFQGNGNRSFPSGEVANVAAALTPFVLEYGREHPWVAATSAAVLVYDAEARMKARGHWQSDVIAGALLGGGIGYLMHERQQPLLLLPLNGGVFVGLSKRF